MAKRRNNKAIILSPRQMIGMREAGKLAADTLLMIGEHIVPGITTEDINTLVHEFTLKHDARPAPLNYKGFPKSVCTSVNEVVCHGIPGPQRLEDGDIINVDVTPVLPAEGGWYGDTSATFYVGEPSPMTKHVVEVTRQALEIGMAVVRPGARIGDIGAAIQQFAESKGCSVVRAYTGHGIGRVFHGPPTVSHVRSWMPTPKMEVGMCFTIEPMINLGTHEVDHLDDGWTVLTRDRALSAQFEHTIVVTEDGCEVMTRRDGVLKNSEDKEWAVLGPLSCYLPDEPATQA